MPAADWPGLVGAVSPDPWVERDRLTAGEPGEIYRLAGVFEAAAREASAASEAGARASLATGEAYRVDGGEVHAVDVHTNRTRELLSGSGDDLERIGKILRGIGDELTASTGSAVKRVSDLEGELQTAQNAFAQYEQGYKALRASAPPLVAMQLDAAYDAALAAFRSRSQDLAQQAGRDVEGIVSTYDDMLGGRSTELAALGYSVPADVNEGPGDVEDDPAAGRRDAQTVADALDQPPGKQSVVEIDAASAQIRAINDKAEHGIPLTDAERRYLLQFYEELGTDDLARLPGYLQDAAPYAADHRRGPDGLPTSTAQDVYEQTMAPFQDSLMNLSAGKWENGDDFRYEQMPSSVRTLIEGTNLGVTDPATGLRVANERFLQSPDTFPDRNNPSGYLLGGGVVGMDRYRALGELMRSDVAPGADTAQKLADAAIRGKQQLNTIQDMSRWNLSHQMGGGTDDTVRRLDAMIDDTASSQLLSAAGRNVDASSGLLIDDTRRAQILGLNWEDGTGAADVVRSGTDRDGKDGAGGTARQAEAALRVVQEVAHDRDGYLNRMADPVKNAVNGVGVGYLDALAAPTTDVSRPIADRPDARGNSFGPTFELTRQDRDQFLQFVSGTGDDRAAAFQRDARNWAQAGIADALAKGNTKHLDTALAMAGRLDGAITQANMDYTLDVTHRDDEAAVNRAAQLEARAQQGVLNTVAVIGKETAGAVLPGGKLVSPLLSVGTEMVKGWFGVETLPPAPPEAQLPQTRDDLVRADSSHAVLQRDLMLARAAHTAGLFEPGQEPAILTRDGDGDGRVDSHTSSSVLQEQLGPQTRAALDRWGAQHRVEGGTGAVPMTSYNDARSEAFSRTWDGEGAQAESAWRDDGRARELAYADGPRPETPFALPPTDPRVLDDPRYDRIRDRMTG